MNIKFQNIKNKTIVYDENEDYKKRDYQDNIEEILKLENELEQAEKIKDNLLSKIEKANTYRLLKVYIILLSMIPTIPVALVAIIEFHMPFLISIIGTALGDVVLVNIALIIYNFINKDSKKSLKNIKGNKFQYNFLLNHINKKKEQLKKLKEIIEDTEIEETEYIIQKVRDKEQLEKLKNLLNICHILGTKYKSVKEISNSDILIDKDLKEYTEEDIKTCINMVLNRKQV